MKPLLLLLLPLWAAPIFAQTYYSTSFFDEIIVRRDSCDLLKAQLTRLNDPYYTSHIHYLDSCIQYLNGIRAKLADDHRKIGEIDNNQYTTDALHALKKNILLYKHNYEQNHDSLFFFTFYTPTFVQANWIEKTEIKASEMPKKRKREVYKILKSIKRINKYYPNYNVQFVKVSKSTYRTWVRNSTPGQPGQLYSDSAALHAALPGVMDIWNDITMNLKIIQNEIEMPYGFSLSYVENKKNEYLLDDSKILSIKKWWQEEVFPYLVYINSRYKDQTLVNLYIEIKGYASPEGSAAYNMELSRKRAQAVSDYIEQLGQEARQLSRIGAVIKLETSVQPFGESQVPEGVKNKSGVGNGNEAGTDWMDLQAEEKEQYLNSLRVAIFRGRLDYHPKLGQ